VVWDISGEEPDEIDNAPAADVTGLALATNEDVELLEFGVVPGIDPFATANTVDYPASIEVYQNSTITVQILDAVGNPFFQPVPVSVEITGANPQTLTATPLGANTYQFSYEPQSPGDDDINVYMGPLAPPFDEFLPAKVLIGTFTSEITPVTGPLAVELRIEGSSEEFVNGYPVQLFYQDGTLYLEGTTEAKEDPDTGKPFGEVVFADVPYGENYFVYFAKRDFDVRFDGEVYTQSVAPFTKDTEPVAFQGNTVSGLPAGAVVFRLGASGTGHLYEYVAEGRSWTAANNQIREYFADGVEGHLASVYNVYEKADGSVERVPDLNEAENAFLASFLTTVCENEGTKQCRVRSWLGLSDEVEETKFIWTDTGAEAITEIYTNWKDLSKQRDNTDHVEIGPDGFWYIVNGASSVNDGYNVEWDTPKHAPIF
jgi:hypothetical protein